MTTALEHLEAALDHLEKAREKASLGTSMMTNEIIEDLRALIDRTRRNEEDG